VSVVGLAAQDTRRGAARLHPAAGTARPDLAHGSGDRSAAPRIRRLASRPRGAI